MTGPAMPDPASDEAKERALLRPSEAVLDAVRHTVAEEPWRVGIAPALRPAYALRQQHEFRRLIAPGTPLLILLQVLLMGTVLLFYRPLLAGMDAAVWWRAELAVAVLILGGLGLARVPALLAHYPLWVGAMATGILAVRLGQTFALASPDLLQHQSFVCMLVIMVIVLALRLPLMACVATCLAALGLALVAAGAMGWPVDWRHLAVYHGQAMVVALFIAFLLERQQRLAFLQSVLLARESEEKQRLNDELEKLAREDALTGLANRRYFDERLREEGERARREGQPLALLMLDVDHFKRFNDTYGHPAGDACLARLGRLLREAARRPGDLAARYGGEEFVLLLPGIDEAGAVGVAERVLAAIEALAIPHAASPVAGIVSASLGLAVQTPTAAGVEGLLAAADAALYDAKRQGRRRLVLAARQATA